MQMRPWTLRSLLGALGLALWLGSTSCVTATSDKPLLATSVILSPAQEAEATGQVEEASASGAGTTVIIFRHAEKQKGQDPDLTPLGMERAKSLVEVVKDAGVASIYSSQYLRTRRTVEALGEALELEVTVVAASRDFEQYAKDLAAKAVAENKGKAAIISSHSNLVPLVIKALGGAEVIVTEEDYDQLFIVHVPEQGAASLVRARYGPPQ